MQSFKVLYNMVNITSQGPSKLQHNKVCNDKMFSCKDISSAEEVIDIRLAVT